MIDLRLGDCLDVMRGIPDASIDAVITSPPYAMQRKAQYGGIEEANYPAWTVEWMESVHHALRENASVLINIREHVKDGQISDYVHRMRLALREQGWIECDEIIWIKPMSAPMGHPKRPKRAWERILWFSQSRQAFCNPLANGHPSNYIGMPPRKNHKGLINQDKPYRAGVARCTDYALIPIEKQKDNIGINHPAIYPVKLAEWMVKFTSNAGATILDPFMGSGTTGVACVKLNRNFIGIEINPQYFAIAERRIQEAQAQLTMVMA